MNRKRDLEFLYEIGFLRFLPRAWRHFLNPDVESISEHIFRVIWIALILAKGEKVTVTDKIIKMALIHDVIESRTGDVDYISRQYNKQDERLAIEDMLEETSVKDEFMELWKEYEKRETIESKIVKDADNLDVDLELKEQEARGHDTRKMLNPMRKIAVAKHFYTRSAKKLWQEIQDSNPHDWHLKGRNRFNAGDWKKES